MIKIKIVKFIGLLGIAAASWGVVEAIKLGSVGATILLGLDAVLLVAGVVFLHWKSRRI